MVTSPHPLLFLEPPGSILPKLERDGGRVLLRVLDWTSFHHFLPNARGIFAATLGCQCTFPHALLGVSFGLESIQAEKGNTLLQHAHDCSGHLAALTSGF